MSGTFEDLRAWQCAMPLALDVYKTTQSFPRQETYGLTSQLRRRPSQCRAISRKGRAEHPIESSANF